MLKKLKLGLIALLLPALAFAQSYPSPTFQNLTVNGTFTSTGNIGLSSLAAQAANTILANATGSSASPTAIPMAGCNGAAQALQYTNGGGASAFTCNSSIATNGANANITSLSGLTTPLSVSQGGTSSATLTAHNVLIGNGTSALAFAPPVSAGYVLTDNGPGSNPTFQNAAAGRLIGIQTFASSGTYTPTTGTNSVVVLVVAAGGAGGGAVATSSGQTSGGVGGNSGSIGYGRITSGFSGVTVTVGAGGAGASGASGASGGNSSFGSAITTVGGSGGAAASAVSPPNISPATQGSAGSGGSILNAAGNAGAPYIALATTGFAGGDGGAGLYGGAGAGATNGNGGAGGAPGAGGGGASNGPSLAAKTGGNGANGIVIVWEYN